MLGGKHFAQPGRVDLATCAAAGTPLSVAAPFPFIADEAELVRDLPAYPTRRKLRVLVACEYSATVRDAFRARGFDAWSCDLLPTEGDPRWHIQGDAIQAAYSQQWDLLIAHPECTYLCNSGAKHLYAGMKAENGPNASRWASMGAAAMFFRTLLNAPVPHVAIENPIMLGHPRKMFGIPDPAQTIQPWQFGHGETKATCLWLKNLPALVPSNVVAGREQRVFKMAPGPNRWKERSRTFAGIAEAMANQWGDYLNPLQNIACENPDTLRGTFSGGLVAVPHSNGDTL